MTKSHITWWGYSGHVKACSSHGLSFIHRDSNTLINAPVLPSSVYNFFS